MEIQEWWPRVSAETREWFGFHLVALVNEGLVVPSEIVAEVVRAGGSITSDAWWVGRSEATGFYVSDDAVDWILENGLSDNPANGNDYAHQLRDLLRATKEGGVD